MGEIIRKALPLAVTIAIGGSVVAEAKDGGPQPELGPATTMRSVYKHHKVSNGDIEQNFFYVNGALRDLQSTTTRDYARYTPEGALVQDHYTLYRHTKYDALGKRDPLPSRCKLVRHINMKLVPVICVVPTEQEDKKAPQPVYLVHDPDNGQLVPARGIAGAA